MENKSLDPKLLRYILFALLALTSFSMFAVVLLVVLVWRSSNSTGTAPAATTVTATNAPPEVPAAAAKLVPAPGHAAIDEVARQAILADDRQKLVKIVLESSKRSDAAQYQSNLFREAIGQGRRNAIDVLSSQHSIPRDSIRALSLELIETLYVKGDFNEISNLMYRARQLGLREEDAANILRQKLRQPLFSPKYVSELFKALRCSDKTIIEECLAGNQLQREWVINFVENGYFNNAPARMMLHSLDATPENFETLVVLLAKHHSLNQEFLEKNLALFDADKCDKLLPHLKNMSVSEKFAKHMLSMPPATALSFFDQNDSFRFQLLVKWKTAQLKPTLPTDLPLEAYSPLTPAIKRLLDTSIDWDKYQSNKTPLDVLDWLWEQGFRATQRSDAQVLMYLGARHKSSETIEAAISRHGITAQQALEGFDVYATEADLAAEKKTRFKPLEEIIRQGDMACLQMLCRLQEKRWELAPVHPVIFALESGRSEMASYLYEQGAKLNEPQMAGVLAMKDVDLSFLSRTAKSSLKLQKSMEWITLERAVEKGELEAVEKVLAEIDFHAVTPLSEPSRGLGDWRSDPGVEQVILRSLGYPKIMSRLQFEGFPYSGRHVSLAIDTRNVPALKVLLRDLKLRDFVCENFDALQRKFINDRLVCQAMIESGLLEELPTDAQDIIKREARAWGSKKK